MRGWNPDVETDNFKLRQSCIVSCDLEIIGVAETHLYDAKTIKLNGFEWYGQNRWKHINTRKGSGGVGFLVKDSVMDQYNVEVLDDNTEGILWLKCSSKFNGYDFCCCVCYVPPSDSTRAIDLNGFYDSLMCQAKLHLISVHRW